MSIQGGVPSSPAPTRRAYGRTRGAVAQQTSPITTKKFDQGSRYNPSDELWIIARSDTVETYRDDLLPGSGALMTTDNEGKQIPVPLKHTAVNAAINGYIATVDVTQQFHNPFSEKIEAVYVFPLPQNAAVRDFIMKIGERTIRGVIRERNEAERIYHQAKAAGYVASLLTQERPNIFTQSVANIEPGKQIDVQIQYLETLAYADGWFEFVFPMVVGPRFNPPGFTDGVAAMNRGKPGRSDQETEVSYLRPNERSGHDISVEIVVDAGVPIEEYVCASHVLKRSQDNPELLKLALSPNDSIPNKDLVLRYRVAGDKIKSALLTESDEANGGGYFTMMLLPPLNTSSKQRSPLEFVFVLDSSGSMSGDPIRQAKEAMSTGLKLLEPQDSFQLINFSQSASTLRPKPLAATRENIRRGLDHLNELEAGGGTMMIEGIKAALDYPNDPERIRFVVFLTDGYIGNESQILKEIDERIGQARIFSFGVGSSPNRYLLDRMAQFGRGAVAYLGLRDDGGRVMTDFFNRVSQPALANLKIDWNGMNVTEVYPKQIPDLFPGRPVLITGRASSFNADEIIVRARAGNDEEELRVPVQRPSMAKRGLDQVWARQKIASLMRAQIIDASDRLTASIRDVALNYNLMSAYTAFIAVDSSLRTVGDHGTTIAVPVPVPEGVRYDTTVTE